MRRMRWLLLSSGCCDAAPEVILVDIPAMTRPKATARAGGAEIPDGPGRRLAPFGLPPKDVDRGGIVTHPAL